MFCSTLSQKAPGKKKLLILGKIKFHNVICSEALIMHFLRSIQKTLSTFFKEKKILTTI